MSRPALSMSRAVQWSSNYSWTWWPMKAPLCSWQLTIAGWQNAATGSSKCTMEGFRNLLTLDDFAAPGEEPLAVVNAAWHGLFWLVFANVVGVLLAVLLLFPALNPMLGEWTYG